MTNGPIDNLNDKAAVSENIPELSQKKNFLGKWADFFIDRYRITFMIIIIIVIWGGAKGLSLQKEAQPKVTIPYISIMTTYVGASPNEIETEITEPLEEKFEELEDVKEITSTSGFGYSSIFIEFESGLDMDDKVVEVRNKVADIDNTLPEDAETPMVSELKTGESPILVFSLTGNENVLELQAHAKKIQDEIKQVNGVKDTGLLGDVDREISITVDPQKIASYNLSLNDIKRAVEMSNVNFPGGTAKLDGREYNIRTVGKFEDVERIKNTIVKHSGDGQVYLKDIALVVDSYEDAEVYVRKYTKGEDAQKALKNSVIISVKKKESADTIEVKEAIMKMLEDKKADLVPEGIKLELVSDGAEYIDEQLGSVANNAVSGLFLVIVVLFLFIGFRESLIVSTVIPLAICFSLGLMSSYGMTLNEITLFSMILAIGMLVDNAIVIMENIDRLRSLGLNADVASSAATNQIAPAVFSSTLTTLAAFFPMILTSGIMGDYIRSIPLTVIFMLSASFVVAVTVTPSISSIILKRYEGLERQKGNPAKEKAAKMVSVIIVFVLTMIAFQDSDQTGLAKFGFLSWGLAVLFSAGMFIKQFRRKSTHENHPIIGRYIVMMEWIINKTSRKFLVVALALVVFILSIGTIPAGIMKVQMFENEDFELLYLTVQTPPGTNLEDTKESQEQAEKLLTEYGEIKNFVSYIGNNGADIWSEFEANASGVPNKGRIIIQLTKLTERKKTSMQIAEELRGKLKSIPGAEYKVRELESGPPSGSPIELKIKGEEMEKIQNAAKDFERMLGEIEGVRDIETSISDLAPELRVRVDKEKAASYGLDDMTVALAIRNAINGITSTTFRDNQDDIDVVIKTSESKLETVQDVEKLYFYNNKGSKIPFPQVAEIEETNSAMTISHEDGKRVVYVSANVNEETTTAAEATAAFDKKVAEYNMPDGVVFEYGGESEAMGDSFGDMMVNMVIAAILVFIILAVQFNSLSQPMIILFTVPLALIGVMAGLMLTGNSFGFLAFVGVVALVGIAVNDAIVLVDYINYLRSVGYEMKDAIVKTGTTRFIPVFATTITTAGGILPITLKEPFFEPLGVTLIFGLTVATVLTLVVVPTIYSLLEGFKQNRKLKKEQRAQVIVNL